MSKKNIVVGSVITAGAAIIAGGIILKHRHKKVLQSSVPQTSGGTKESNIGVANVTVSSSGTQEKPVRSYTHTVTWDASILHNVSLEENRRLSYDLGRLNKATGADRLEALNGIASVLTYNKIIEDRTMMMDKMPMTKKASAIYLRALAEAVTSTGVDAQEFGLTLNLRYNYRKKAVDIIGKPVINIIGH